MLHTRYTCFIPYAMLFSHMFHIKLVIQTLIIIKLCTNMRKHGPISISQSYLEMLDPSSLTWALHHRVALPMCSYCSRQQMVQVLRLQLWSYTLCNAQWKWRMRGEPIRSLNTSLIRCHHCWYSCLAHTGYMRTSSAYGECRDCAESDGPCRSNDRGHEW
jgi:hypothetical protein